MNSFRYIYILTFYFLNHDKRSFLPPCVLSFFGIFLLCLVHAEYALPMQGIISFFALWGFVLSISFMYSLEEDFNDDTFGYLLSEGFSVHSYAFARFLTVLIFYLFPLLVSELLGLLVMQISLTFIWGLLLNHLQLLVGIIGLQLTLCMTSSMEKRMTNLLVFIPFWVPGFLYLVGSSAENMMLLPQAGMVLTSIGLNFLLIQNAYRWRNY